MPKFKSPIEIRFSADFLRLSVDEQSRLFGSLVHSVVKKFGLTLSPVPTVPNDGAGEFSCESEK